MGKASSRANGGRQHGRTEKEALFRKGLIEVDWGDELTLGHLIGPLARGSTQDRGQHAGADAGVAYGGLGEKHEIVRHRGVHRHVRVVVVEKAPTDATVG